ncbi:MAG: thiamine diphosphokinase [Candidatus Cloacimonetes bacterium]|nr:thiamine diphosphokinase [Candidatus Cloacimonadota bacterium]
MKILIILNGQKNNSKYLKNIVNNIDFIIAADGGANSCSSLHLIPDIIIGDLDSISDEAKTNFSQIPILYIKNQNETDLQKALEYALNKKPDKIYIFACLGKREDHSLINLLILNNFVQKHRIKIELITKSARFRILPFGNHEIINRKNKIVSLFSYNTIENLNLSGFQYELKNKNYLNNFIGLSNVYTSDRSTIKFSSGVVFLIEPFERIE